MTASTIVFIESNTSGTGRLFIQKARDLGFSPLLFARDPGRYPFTRLDYVRFVKVDTRSVDAVVDACRSYGHNLAGVVTSSEYAVAVTAAVAARFGCPGLPASAAAQVRDKAFQRKSLRDVSLDDTKYALCSSADDLIRAAREIGYPLIVKPRSASGSLGVRLVSTDTELFAAASEVKTKTGARTVMVEEPIPGREFSAEVFHGQVIGLTAKLLGPLPSFVEIGHDFPARIDRETEARLTVFAQRVAKILRLNSGPAHIEIRDDGVRARLIEANPRLAGGFIPRLIELSTSVDLIEATLMWAVGHPVDLTARMRHNASIRFVLADREGRLSELGFDALRCLPGVAETRSYKDLGDWITLDGDFTDRIGHVIAVDPVSAAKAADDALAKVKVSIEKKAVLA